MDEENEKTAPLPTAETFAIHSVARAQHNRTARAALPQKPRRKQHIGGEARLAHGRPLIVSAAFVEKHIEELIAKQDGHVLELRTMDGRRIDLRTGERATSAPGQMPPNFQPDSVNNDKNFPGLPGSALGTGVMADDTTTPQVLKDGEKPALFKDAAQQAENADDENKPAPVPVPTDIDTAVAEAQAEAALDDEASPETAPEASEAVSSEKKSGRKRR